MALGFIGFGDDEEMLLTIEVAEILGSECWVMVPAEFPEKP